MANKEEKNVVVREIIKDKRLKLENWFKENINWPKAAIEIAGIPKRKENFAASFLSQPNKSAKEIVTPDLDTPGIIANAWAKPINKLSR